MSKAENFGNKRNSNGLDKNPQNINKSGLNRKSFSLFNKQCEEKGVEKLTEKEYIATLGYLVSLTESEIKEMADDKEQPLALRLMIAELTDPRSRGKTIQDFRDYLFKQGIQKIELSTKKPIINFIDGSKPT